jgi:hypothetical protein
LRLSNCRSPSPCRPNINTIALHLQHHRSHCSTDEARRLLEVMQTPPRPSLPGTWLQTPAGKPPAPAPSFSSSVTRKGDPSYTPRPSQPTSMGLTRADQNSQVQQQQSSPNSSGPSRPRSPDERAARAVNEALESESRIPELDAYLSRMSNPLPSSQQALMEV